ncbi:hypothetical protein JYU34_017466 [Plutella xylostella]|uniref:Secreted protein n=1 Tax=Plutella xylostella TaxID=51655 RepID=A0ABQ7Q192_PLUXY|nr:hypothetical protein JYU34_017466 [Plutella xylostella]
MRSGFVLVLVTIAIILQWSSVECHPPPQAVTTTSRPPWTTRIKNGVGRFLEGAAVVSAVQNAYHSGKSGRPKSYPDVPLKKH